MMELKGKRILIFQQRGWGTGVGHGIAKLLQKEGCALAALTLKRTTHAFTIAQKDVHYDLIVNNDQMMAEPLTFLEGANISLEEVCAEMGVDSVWPLIMSLRNHVRSYGEKFYYGFTPNVADAEMTNYVKALLLCVRRFFETFKPDLILAPNFVALPHIIFQLYAKKRGVPMVAVTDSKVRGVYMFCHDHKDTNAALRLAVESLNRGATSPNEAKARAFVESQRAAFQHPTTFVDPNASVPFLKRVRAELAPYRDIVKWYVKRPVNHLKNLGITTDYRPPRIILRDHYCQKAYKRFMDRFPYDDFSAIKKFAYLPLQYQPEESLDVKAPYFNNQIETARQIAISMPDDYTLVVKEHPGMVGYRPPSYIKKVARLVNVQFIDYRIPSNEVMRRAGLVISPNSTSLSEAAFYNKPAIQLGNLETTQLLPNVLRHTDMTTLSTAIREALRMDTQSEQFEQRLRNFVAAVYDTGFEMNYGRLWEHGENDNDGMATFWNIYRSEILRLLSTSNTR